MLILAEQLAILLQGEHVAVGIDARLIDLVQGHQLVTNLVGGVGEHQDDLLTALCNTAQADCKAVTGQNGENDADRAAAQLCFDVGGNVLDAAVVALRASDDGFGQGDDVAVAQLKAFDLSSLQDAFGDESGEIIALTNDGATDAAGNGTDSSCVFHNDSFCNFRLGGRGVLVFQATSPFDAHTAHLDFVDACAALYRHWMPFLCR